jgi:hypothetical protein
MVLELMTAITNQPTPSWQIAGQNATSYSKAIG